MANADNDVRGEATVGATRLVVVVGDLTAQGVDAIVNAANDRLQHGGGVAGAIARAGGPTIKRESDDWVAEHGALASDQAAVTGAGDLPARYVIHVAGPVYAGDGSDEPHLRAAVRAACAAAVEHGARTVAFPAISAGIYGYPLGDATAILADEVATFARDGGSALDEVRFVALDDRTADAFAVALDALR